MKRIFDPGKLKLQRKLAGYSQQRLAEAAGIHIRTLQRIESGEVTPQDHTLTQLESVLNTPVAEFYCHGETIVRKERALIHATPLATFLFPLGNLIMPFVAWFFYSHRDPEYVEEIKTVLNLQILLSLLFIVGFIWMGISITGFIAWMAAVGLSVPILALINTIQVIREKQTWYPGLKFIS